jgi:hypothetical protein
MDPLVSAQWLAEHLEDLEPHGWEVELLTPGREAGRTDWRAGRASEPTCGGFAMIPMAAVDAPRRVSSARPIAATSGLSGGAAR